jgi:uncharacterized protein YegL
VKTCQEFCWSYPGCVSSDITSYGVCYLNYARGPTAISYTFSLLEFECCNPSAQPTCQTRPSDAGSSGPCYSGTAKFIDYQPGKYIAGNDIKVSTGQTVESCRNLCWNTPNCQSADLTNEGVCYLNNVKGPISTSPFFSLIDFDCCSKLSQCVDKQIASTGSPCPSGSVRWAEPKKQYYVPGNDITSRGGMTIDSCRDWCWTYAGCVSADITNTGVCYLNYAAGPTSTSEIFTLLEFECCPGNKPECEVKQSNAGDAGPCKSGIAKFLDYQPSKYIIGMDIKVATQQTVQSCRQLCWDTPKCQSADLTQDGVCYLNSVKGPLATSSTFSFIDFECCEPVTTSTVAPDTTTAEPITTTSSAEKPTPAPCTKETIVEITFVLDASLSIGLDNYVNGLKPAVKGIINLMLPGANDVPSKSRVACVVYSTNTVVEWTLDKYTTKDELYKAVDAIPYYNGFTATGDGLHEALVKIHPQVRRDMKHIVILITDGEQNWGTYDYIIESKKLRDAGVALFVIGVGNEIDKNALDKLAAGPDYRADVTNYKDLLQQMEKLATMTCKEAVKT